MIKESIGITALLVGLTGPQAPAQAYEYVNPNDGYKACMYRNIAARSNSKSHWHSFSHEAKIAVKATAHQQCN